MSVTLQWLERLYGRSPGYFTILAFANGKPRAVKWYSTQELRRAARTIEHYADRYDMYVGVATHREPASKGRGTGNTVMSIAGFWSDIDIGTIGHKPASLPNPESEAEALALLEGQPEPTAIIATGGGLQVWWLFDEPWVFSDPQEAARASGEWQQRLIGAAEKKGRHLDSVGDLARILRVPGTFNHKTGTPRRVEVRKTDGPTYHIAELTALTYRPPPSESSWAAILEPHGWTKVGTRPSDGATLWARPGKDPKDGHSAVTDPFGVPVMVVFSSSCGLPVGPGQHLTKDRVYALLNGEPEDAAHLREVERELRRLRVQIEARDRMNAEAVRKRPLPTAMPLPELLAIDEEDTFRVDGLWPTAGRVVLAAAKKTGKTTMVVNLVRSLVTGEPFLDVFDVERVTGEVRVVDFEMTRPMLRSWYGQAGIDTDQVSIWPLRGQAGVFDVREKHRRAEIAGMLRDAGTEILIIDPLRPVIASLGIDENSNTEVGRFLDSLDALMNESDLRELLVVHHTGNANDKRARGASVLGDWPDATWYYTRVEDEDDLLHEPRYLRAEGRNVDLKKTEVLFDHETLTLILGSE